MNQEEHNRIVAAGLKMMKVKPQDIPDFERLLLEGERRIKNIRDTYIVMEENAAANGHNLNRPQISGEIMGKYLDNFCHYDKEETLFFLAHFLTQATVKEILG